ncbi:invasin domain 3-containing protein [Candidatus Poribacteria bacterium]
MKQKVTHGILLAILAQLIISTSVIAAPSLILEASSDQVDVGDELTLEADLVEINNLFAVSFELEYDPALLEIGDISAGDFLGNDIIFFSMPGDGSISISMTKKAGSIEASGTGTLAELKFKAVSQGEVIFSVKEDTLALAQFDGSFIPDFSELEVVPPTVTVGSTEELTLTVDVSPESLPADGSSSAIITATLVSSSGSPQGGETFQITMEQGNDLIQNKRDNGDGTYTATYIASEQPGTVTLTVTVGVYSEDIAIHLTEVEPEQNMPNISLTSETASAHIMETISMKMALTDGTGREIDAEKEMVIDLTSDSETGQFSFRDSFSPTISSVIVRPGTSSVELYYRDTKSGEVTIAVSSTGFEEKSLKLTIKSPTLSIIHEAIEHIELGEDILIIANITGEPKPTKLTVSYRKPTEDSFVEIDTESAGGGRWESFLPPGASRNTVGIIYYLDFVKIIGKIGLKPSNDAGLSIAYENGTENRRRCP